MSRRATSQLPAMMTKSSVESSPALSLWKELNVGHHQNEKPGLGLGGYVPRVLCCSGGMQV